MPFRSHTIDLSNQQLNDDGLRQWFLREGPQHLQRFGHSPLNDVNVSRNSLTDEGVGYLIDFLLERKQSTRRLKLFENQLREPSAICQLIEDQTIGVGANSGLSEIHLSHNNISAVALGRILDSLRKRAASCGSLRPPVWLRVECNDGLEDFSHDLAEMHREKGLKLCLQGGIRGSGCNIRSCKYGADVHLRLEDHTNGAKSNMNNNNSSQRATALRSRSIRRRQSQWASESPGRRASPSGEDDGWQRRPYYGEELEIDRWAHHRRWDGWRSGHKGWRNSGWYDRQAETWGEDDWHGDNEAAAVASGGGRVQLADAQFDDARLQRWCTEEGPQELQRLGPGVLEAIDLSRNSITDEGVRSLVALLQQHRQATRRLKLFRNKLCEPNALCQLIEDADLGAGAADGLSELHLSSNSITAEGLRRILESLRKCKITCRGFKPPIWLRVERNLGLEAEAVQSLATEYVEKGLNVCLEGGGPNSSCTIKWCRHDADVHVHIEGGNWSSAKPSWTPNPSSGWWHN